MIEGPTEYMASRLTRKERKQTIMDEVLGDSKLKSYTKKTFMGIQTEKSKKRKIFSRKGNNNNKKQKSSFF